MGHPFAIQWLSQWATRDPSPLASFHDFDTALPPRGGSELRVIVTGYPRAKFFADELENPNRPGLSANGGYAPGNVVFVLGRPMHCVVFVGDKAHLFGMFTQLWRVIENRTLIVVETDR